MNCTVTPGGGPTASTDEAVSCTSLLGEDGGGEVAESELFADGVDIFAVFWNFLNRHNETLPQNNSSPAWSLVLGCLEEFLYTCTLFVCSPKYHTKLPILVGFKEWASAQQFLDPA